MELSVVIPVYNVAATVRRAVESVLAQKVDGMEVLLVDDGSTDNSQLICNEIAREDSRVRVLTRPNGGLSAARNTGIENATGDFITFVDSDDFLAPETYQDVLSLMREHPEIGVAEFPAALHYGASWQRKLSLGDRIFSSFWDYWLSCRGYSHTYAWNKIYKRSLFDMLRFPEGRVFEDVSLTPLLLQAAECIATVSSGLYYYCQNPDGITATAGPTETRMLLEAQTDVFDDVPQEVARKHKKMMKEYYAFLLNIQLSLYAKGDHNLLLPKKGYTGNLKLDLLQTLGLKNLCRLTTIKEKIISPRR